MFQNYAEQDRQAILKVKYTGSRSMMHTQKTCKQPCDLDIWYDL